MAVDTADLMEVSGVFREGHVSLMETLGYSQELFDELDQIGDGSYEDYKIKALAMKQAFLGQKLAVVLDEVPYERIIDEALLDEIERAANDTGEDLIVEPGEDVPYTILDREVYVPQVLADSFRKYFVYRDLALKALSEETGWDVDTLLEG